MITEISSTKYSNPIHVSSVSAYGPEFKKYSRLQKGYLYEMHVQSLLDKLGVSHNSNPKQYEQWKGHKGKPYDIKMKLQGMWYKVECKLCLKPIFKSWFKKDWLKRDADIFVTNDKNAIPKKCRKQLKRRGRRLFDTIEFMKWVLKKLVQKPQMKPLTNRIFEYMKYLSISIVRTFSSIVLKISRTNLNTQKIIKILSSNEKEEKIPRDHEPQHNEKYENYNGCNKKVK
jgi:hypothetical protein